ncbi:unnamed protein product [Adineta steineri]|uniref:Uncharacterized protein n=1 Tax=Adineta steineri TaxID=433720 RepID=A0A815GYS5_9BILA|nr:unnamed protein product [Adineta steineri]
MYPLFAIETSRRFSGYVGLSIACMLSATLSTFSSGANSIATVILEDISKQLTKKYSMLNEEQVTFSKKLSKNNSLLFFPQLSFFVNYLAICIGCL